MYSIKLSISNQKQVFSCQYNLHRVSGESIAFLIACGRFKVQTSPSFLICSSASIRTRSEQFVFQRQYLERPREQIASSTKIAGKVSPSEACLTLSRLLLRARRFGCRLLRTRARTNESQDEATRSRSSAMLLHCTSDASLDRSRKYLIGNFTAIVVMGSSHHWRSSPLLVL